MNKFLTLLVLMFVCLNGWANEQTTAKKLVDISFGNTTPFIKDKGTRANATSKVGKSGTADYLANPFDTSYPNYGCTRMDASNYFYGTFDKGDELDNAFSTSCTWEVLVRLESLYDASSSGAVLKFFSCQQLGGWTFTNKESGLFFNYLTNENGTVTDNKVSYKTASNTLVTGKFYHLVATMDRGTKQLKLFVNGKKVGTTTILNGEWARPQSGSVLGEKDMWFAFGGDPNGNQATDNACENSNASTFVFARIYDNALTDAAAEGLYTTGVKKYTEPQKPSTNDMIFDAVFDKTGATNASAYNTLVPLDKMGAPSIAYNSNQQRYEAKFNGNAANYWKFSLAEEPSIENQMGDGYAYEMFVTVASKTPGSVRPIGWQMGDYYGGAIHFRDAFQHVAFEAFTRGCNEYGKFATPGWRWSSLDLPLGYHHYIVSYDRIGKKICFYENGSLVDTRKITNQECMAWYWAPSAWVAIGGNCSNWYRVNANCSYPHNGKMSIARCWGKAISNEDARMLYAEASMTNFGIEIGELGYATTCLPKNYILPEGLTAYIVTTQNTGTATLKKIGETGSVIAYNTPVILAGKPGMYTLNAANISGSITFADATGNMLEGSYISKIAKENEIYALQTGKKGLPILVKATEKEKLSGSCAWLPVQDGNSEEVKNLIIDGKTLADEKSTSTPDQPQPQPATKKDPFTFTVMGNSISTYENYVPPIYAVYYSTTRGYTNGVQVGDTYWMRLSRLTGMTFLTNSSWSGSCVAHRTDKSEISEFTSDDRIASVGRAGVPDAILIAGGTNDWSGGKVPLGEYNKPDVNTFRGAYTLYLQKLKAAYPNIVPLCCSIFPRSQATDQANAAGWTQKDANESIEYMAKQFGGYFIDCTGVPFSNDWDLNTFDKLHPRSNGHKLLAECMAKSLLEQGYISDTLKKNTEVSTAEKLLDLSFNENGIINNGTYNTKVGKNGGATVVYDKDTKTYLGCTGNSNSDYFYANYDANTTLTNAMNNSATWEVLVRLDNQNDATEDGQKVKFFSSQEDGGWSFFNTPNFVKFEYETDAAGVRTFVKYETDDSTMIAGKFYHMVVTLDRTSHIIRYFVNGKLVATGTRVSNELKMPMCGSVLGQKNMWVGLGADPGCLPAGSDGQNGGACSFVFARIYNGALTEDAALALYDDKVKQFTEPTFSFNKDLIMNAEFTQDGAINNVPETDEDVVKVGNVKTAYDETQNRYVAQFNGNTSEFFKYNLGNHSEVISKMADEYTVEVCCQTDKELPSASMRPATTGEVYGFALHMNNVGKIAYGTLTYGPNALGTITNAPWVWTDAGTTTADYMHYLLVFDRKNGSSKMYINGTEKGSRSMYFKEGIKLESAPKTWIGIGGTPASTYEDAVKTGLYPFKGNISFVRLWSKALSDKERTALASVASLGGASYTINGTTGTGYAAVCLPYAFVVPEGCNAYIVTAEDASYITLTWVGKPGDIVPAFAPILISGTAKKTVILTPGNAANVNVDLTGNLLTGTFGQTTIGAKSYYLGSSTKGMMKVSSTYTTGAFSAWLPENGYTKTLRNFNFATGIEGITNKDKKQTDIYDLNGKKVLKPTKGIYIQDGRKIWVK